MVATAVVLSRCDGAAAVVEAGDLARTGDAYADADDDDADGDEEDGE